MKNHKNKIAIFGAADTSGGCLLSAILSDTAAGDWEVLAVTRHPTNLPGTVKALSADYADLNSLIRVLEDLDTVVYALPVNREMEGWNANLVKAADICQVERLVRFSAPLADACSSFLPLQVHGRMDECAMGRKFGKVAIVRPNFLMQDFIAYHGQMVRDGTLRLAAGEGRISYVDLQDVSSAVVKMLHSFDSYDGQIADMTGAVAWNNAEIAEIFSDVLRKKCTYQALDATAFSDSLKARGLDAFQMQFILELQELADMDELSFIGEGIYAILHRRPQSFYAFVMDNRACWGVVEERVSLFDYSGPNTRNVSSNVVRPLDTL